MRNSHYGPTPVVPRSLLIPYDINERIREYAAAKRVSMAQVINEALRRYVEEVINKELPEQDRQTDGQTE